MTETADNVIPFKPRTGRRPRRKVLVETSTPVHSLIPSWERALRAANKASRTITVYLRAANRFAAFLDASNLARGAEDVTPDEIRSFLIHERERAGASTSAAAHAYLGVFFKWLIKEGERTTFSPVLQDDRPKVSAKARKYLTIEEIARLLASCKGADFASRRDAAIITVFTDNGLRVGGLVGLRLDDVDLSGRRLRIVLKGGKEHWVPIGDKAVLALDRYLRVRGRHAHADSPWLWLAIRGLHPLKTGGVENMLHRRGEQAGVDNVHPHRFRGTSAHMMLAAGASPDAVQRILGWKSPAMLRHYTEELADERARADHARFSPGDRL